MAEPWMLRKQFERLPREAQDEVLKFLEEALMMRGGSDLRNLSQVRMIDAIAGVFEKHGMEIMQYT